MAESSQIDLPKRMEDLIVKVFHHPKSNGPYVAAFFDGEDAIQKANSVIYSALVYLKLYKKNIPNSIDNLIHDFKFGDELSLDPLEFVEAHLG